MLSTLVPRRKVRYSRGNRQRAWFWRGRRRSSWHEPRLGMWAFLRGDYFWRHERRWENRLALIICGVFGCTNNARREGGDCRRCWR